MASTAFSSADAAVIQHEVELDTTASEATAASTKDSVVEMYCIQQTARDLLYEPNTDQRISPALRRVALQFPDEALIDSVPVFHALNNALNELCEDPPELYVLADTSYGSCCVDEVAAAHVAADALVHYGHTCLSPTAKIPALYVLPRYPVDVEEAVEGLCKAAARLPQDPKRKAWVVTCDVAYEHQMDTIREQLQEKLGMIVVRTRIDFLRTYADRLGARRESLASPAQDARPPPPFQDPPSAISLSLLGAGRQIDLPSDITLEQTNVLYLGGESRALTHLLLTLGSQFPIASYDLRARSAHALTGQTNRLLMRRYAMIQKARDASVIGLVIGTLGVQHYLPLVRKLREMLTSSVSRRKVYTISVGKLNPAKLANFQEIEAFVLVACPENSLLDTKEFQRPIVTPWEMMLAMQAHSGKEVPWTGEYILNFTQAIRDADQVHDEQQSNGSSSEHGDDSDHDRPHYSFVTGTYVSRTKYGDDHKSINDLQTSSDSMSDALQHLSVEPHQLSVRDKSGKLVKVLDSAALAHHQQRSWTGLDQNEGSYAPAKLEQGMEGFAQHYRSATGDTEGSQSTQ